MNIILKLLFCVIGGVSAIIFLYKVTDLPNKHKNGFNRNFYTVTPIKPLYEIVMPSSVSKLAGKIDSEVLFSLNTKVELMGFKTKKRKISHYPIHLNENNQRLIGKVYDVQVLNDTCTIIAGNVPMIIQIDFSKKIFKKINLDKPSIHTGVYQGKGKYFFRRYNSDINDQVYTRYNEYTKEFKPHKIDNPVYHDGGILSDGEMLFDKREKTTTYLHYYQNTITVIDSNNSSYKTFVTIDTVKFPKFKTGKGNKIKTAPVPVNQTGCVFNGSLFVCSNLKADNESAGNYYANVPIDHYNNITGKYLGTFYVSTLDNKIPKSIYVDGNELAILFHSNVLRLYSLNELRIPNHK